MFCGVLYCDDGKGPNKNNWQNSFHCVSSLMYSSGSVCALNLGTVCGPCVWSIRDTLSKFRPFIIVTILD
jgi:hypothetical protein